MVYVINMNKKKNTLAVQRWRRERKNSQLWFTPKDYRTVKLAANLVRRPMSQFCLIAVLEAAKKTLEEVQK
jgi:uncharacterized protein (DUF1778 family)